MSSPYQAPSSSLASPTTEPGAGKAKASLILGLLSILAWIVPLFGIPMTITGLVLGIKGLGPQRRGSAIAGIVLAIFFLILSLINSVIGAYIAATGRIPLINAPARAAAPDR